MPYLTLQLVISMMFDFYWNLMNKMKANEREKNNEAANNERWVSVNSSNACTKVIYKFMDSRISVYCYYHLCTIDKNLCNEHQTHVCPKILTHLRRRQHYNVKFEGGIIWHGACDPRCYSSERGVPVVGLCVAP